MKKLIAIGLAAVLALGLLTLPVAAQAEYTVYLEPYMEGNLMGEDHTVTATVLDDGDNPVENVLVTFWIEYGPNYEGPHTNSTYLHTARTSANGQASWTYTGAMECGEEGIIAWANYDEDPLYAGEPYDEAYKYWLLDKFSGGGKIIQEGEGKSKTWPKITWGGWAGTADLGGWIELGAFEVTFHNVSENDLDKAKFVSEDQELGITELNWLIYGDQSSCPDAYPPESEANFVWLNVPGSLELEDGTVLEDCMLGIRASDNGEPGNIDDPEGDVATDSIAFALWYDGDLIYESWLWGDFDADQDDCFSIRHELDSGNLQIVVLPD